MPHHESRNLVFTWDKPFEFLLRILQEDLQLTLFGEKNEKQTYNEYDVGGYTEVKTAEVRVLNFRAVSGNPEMQLTLWPFAGKCEVSSYDASLLSEIRQRTQFDSLSFFYKTQQGDGELSGKVRHALDEVRRALSGYQWQPSENRKSQWGYSQSGVRFVEIFPYNDNLNFAVYFHFLENSPEAREAQIRLAQFRVHRDQLKGQGQTLESVEKQIEPDLLQLIQFQPDIKMVDSALKEQKFQFDVNQDVLTQVVQIETLSERKRKLPHYWVLSVQFDSEAEAASELKALQKTKDYAGDFKPLASYGSFDAQVAKTMIYFKFKQTAECPKNQVVSF